MGAVAEATAPIYSGGTSYCVTSFNRVIRDYQAIL